MSGPQSPVPTDHPMMIAWEKYKAGDDYGNSFKWAEHEQYRAGSMWAAFVAGWEASAPPAASAERDDDIALIQLIFANSKVTRATGERIVRAIFAAGYRKLAPAQSVGQSAAQGVEQAPSMQGLERKEYWGALWDAAASIFHKRPNSYGRDLFESAELWRDLERLREALNVGARLSALPKGQEHEG